MTPPLVPNNDLFLVNFTITLMGYGAGLSALMAVTAALMLLVHAVLIIGFSLYLLVRNRV